MIVVPVYNMLLTPDATLFFQTDQLRESAGGKGVAVNEKIIFIVARENQALSEMSAESFYPIGLAGAVTELTRQGYAVIRTQYRVNIENVEINPDHTISLSLSRRAEIEDLDQAVAAEKLKNLLQEMRHFSAGFQWADSASYYIDRIDSLGGAACLLSPWLKLTNAKRYELLAEDSRKARAEAIETILYDFLEVGRITNEAVSSQQKEHQQMIREAAIKRQMEHLQKELDEMHPENVTDAQRFAQKIAESGMNDAARREAEKVLNRFKQEGKESVESGILYDWLDFVTSLSWQKEEATVIDLDRARRILDEDHYGLDKVKDRVIQQIAVMNLKRQQSGSILLFVGAPGTGKTSIGKSIARALGRQYVRVSLGGVHDEADIRGHRRTYIGAMAGRIMDGIQKSGVSNPVVVLDEVDKLADSFHGSPASALLEVLDPEQNTFRGYTPLEKLAIAREHLVPKSMEAMGIPADRLSVGEEALETLISDYTMEAGVRGLRKHIDALCRALAVRVASEPEGTIAVTPDLVRDTMETRPVQHEKVLPEPRAGVVTGLAWTPVGGEILHIETLLTEGKGEVVITGQLGDVMKESARIALSLVKSLFPQAAELLRKNDLHIHVPAGAVPKDGPSAGVTLTTALASLVTGRIVDPHIAMTGEVALRGAVTPIGGLPEKLMAAQRAGVTKVFIPSANLFDLRDVAPEVKEKMEIVAVSSVTELLTGVGILAPAALTA